MDGLVLKYILVLKYPYFPYIPANKFIFNFLIKNIKM